MSGYAQVRNGSKGEILAASKSLPLLSQQRTSRRPTQLVHSAQTGSRRLLFDHLVGAGAFVPAAFAMGQRRRDSFTGVDKNMVEAIDGKRPVN